MCKFSVTLAAIGLISIPAYAQASDQTITTTAAAQATQSQPKMVKKRVCTRTESETGSRVGGTRVCKTIEVPAKASGEANKDRATQSESGGAD